MHATFNYKCISGHIFESFEKKIGAPLPKCPKCNTKFVKRLIGAPAIDMKGTILVKDRGNRI